VRPAILREEATPTVDDSLQAENSQNIVGIASETLGFSTLTTAIEAANVGSVLSVEGPLTVFAPTDAAFAALPEGTLEALLLPGNSDLLVKLLYNHVAYGDLTSDKLSMGAIDTFDSAVGVTVTPTGVEIDEASVVQADIEASNGVIHAVDQVLVPAGFTEQLQARISTPATATTTTTTTTSEAQATRAGSLQESAIERTDAVSPIEPATPVSQPAPTAPEEPVRGLW